MAPRENTVALPPSAVVIALNYWAGDLPEAMRLARLIAAIEPRRRDDVLFAFCPRRDVEWTAEQQDVFMKVAGKIPSMRLLSNGTAVGHPDGSWALWRSTVSQLADAWATGKLNAHSVFTVEADGCPLRADWIDRLLAAHGQTIRAGKRVTGCLMDRGVFPHINGSLMAHLSMWFDRPSLHRTPPDQAWDLFHAAVLTSEARPTGWIKNLYGVANWSDESLEVLSRECAWLSSTKDSTAVSWAERTLAPRAPALGTEEPTPVSGPRRVRVNG